ncbi:hypothetical protein ASE75_05110 [Sphingomonas sp. Leaf17]|uniref:serine hydrolase n=1 Tax=Sphingomonas sp. Leaf17 TaxID=1735683 RepID=UPI0006FA481B|nr:serine hydrolase [Sphingomonas sp. Leaf17]KQM65629.1 hypothetical protein ASE75_05110 [Sphingomonas sp. Leaf17]
MRYAMTGLALVLTALPMMTTAARAQSTVAPDPAVRARADSLIAVLNGGGDFDGSFSPAFRAEIPREKMVALSAQVRETLGTAQRVETLTPRGAWAADLIVGYERGTAAVTLTLDPTPPHVVTGLRITGMTQRDDSFARLEADLRALPGMSGYVVMALGNGAPTRVAGYNSGTPAPLGSAFKLWVLAEASRQVTAGQRRWSDVVTLGPRSLASGVLHAWPKDAPVTLQTLATLMISVSDNTATDALMTALGRDSVNAVVARTGVVSGPRTLPLLTTRELIAIKADPALSAAWGKADAGERKRLLAANTARFATAPLDASIFAGNPVAIDSVEWFGSPDDMARTLDWLRRNGDATARAILAVNPGAAAATADALAYLGYKGGSEPGVITMNYLAQVRDGRWFAVAGNWHRSDAAVSEKQFASLMTRALSLAVR